MAQACCRANTRPRAVAAASQAGLFRRRRARPSRPRAATAAMYLVMAAELVLIARIKIHQNRKRQMHSKIWYAAIKCRENLQSIKNRRDFTELVRELLTNALPLENLEPAGGNSPNIDLTGSIKGNSVAIMCQNTPQSDQKITKNVIQNFWREMKQGNYKQGIVFTTGTFTDEAQRFARRMQGYNKIYLFDVNNLVRLARRAKHPVFPEAVQQEEVETRVTGLEIALSIKENIMTSRKKALLFAVLGTLFLVLATLYTGFIGYVYLFFGIVNLFVGFTGIILAILRKNELLLDSF